MRCLLAAAALFAFALPVHAQARRCADLPPVSATEARSTSLTIVRLPRIPSAKELYLRAVCGVRPASVWSLIDSGEGGVIQVPDDLADALDTAIPYLPKVRFMYVRGGGPNREAIVVLFADGYDGPHFNFDHNEPWTLTSVRGAAFHWNKLPYEFLRLATRQLHDAARFRNRYTFRIRLLGFEIPLVSQSRGLANPMGTVFGATRVGDSFDLDRTSGASFWIHELGHYLHYERQGANALAYARGFTAISRRNVRILGMRIPFWYEERYLEARNRGCGGEEPWGYVSRYACGGEWITEDFAETMTVAMGATQVIRTQPYDLYNNGNLAPRFLYDREGSDGPVLAQKAAFVRELLGIDFYGPQDADGDGEAWEEARAESDCADINPVRGRCRNALCTRHIDCDDGNPCTDDLCGDLNRCRHAPVDADGDGSADTRVDSNGDGSLDTACEGSDCDSADPNVFVGTVRSCTNRCGATRQQQCTSNGTYSECPAPESCVCVAGETEVVACGARCGTRTLVCDGVGYDESAPCENEGECIPGSRTFVRNETEDIICAGGGVVGVETYALYEVCNGTCTLEAELERELVGRDEVSSPEVCDGIDNDCNGRTDNGCPSSFRHQAAPSGGYIGRDRGDWRTGTCPSGYVATAIEVDRFRDSNRFDGLRLRCRRLDLVVDEGAVWDYSAGLGATQSTAWAHGNHADRVLTCPSGTAASAIRARDDNTSGFATFITGVQLECVRPDITNDHRFVRLPAGRSDSWPRAADETSNCSGGFVTGVSARRGRDGIRGLRAECRRVTLTLN